MRKSHASYENIALHKSIKLAYLWVIGSLDTADGTEQGKEATMTFIRSFATWRRYRETCRELEKLTERELGDLGIDRSLIPLIARRAI